MNYKLTSMSAKKSITIIIIFLSLFITCDRLLEKKEGIEICGIFFEQIKKEDGCVYYRNKKMILKKCKQNDAATKSNN